MDDLKSRYAAGAWSMLEVLAKLRKSVKQELGFIHSVSPQLSTSRLEAALAEIDSFCATISGFLAKQEGSDAQDLDMGFEQLDWAFESLCDEVGQLLGK